MSEEEQFDVLKWISENNVSLNRDYAGKHVAISKEGVEFADEDLEVVFDFLNTRKDGFDGITLHLVGQIQEVRIMHELEDLSTLVQGFLTGDPAVVSGQEQRLADRITTKLVVALGGLQEPYRAGRRGFDRLRETLLRQRYHGQKVK